MAKNKRFSYKIREETTQYEIIDNWKTGDFPFLEPFFYKKSAKDLAKFLNELNDENKQLKTKLKLKEAYDSQIKRSNKYFEGIEDWASGGH